MEKEKNIMKMEKQDLNAFISTGKKMEKQKNMIKVGIYYLKVNIYMIKK